MPERPFPIHFRSRWRYVGRPPGRGELFTVVEPAASDVLATSADQSWRGPGTEFLKQFEHVDDSKAVA